MLQRRHCVQDNAHNQDLRLNLALQQQMFTFVIDSIHLMDVDNTISLLVTVHESKRFAPSWGRALA